MKSSEVLRGWMEMVWNQRDNRFIEEHLADDCQIEGLPESSQSVEGFAAYRDTLVAAIPDLHIEVLECMEEGEKVIGVLRVTGTHAATERPVDFKLACIAVIREDRIVEACNVIDFLTMLQQTGLVQSDALEKGMLPGGA